MEIEDQSWTKGGIGKAGETKNGGTDGKQRETENGKRARQGKRGNELRNGEMLETGKNPGEQQSGKTMKLEKKKELGENRKRVCN